MACVQDVKEVPLVGMQEQPGDSVLLHWLRLESWRWPAYYSLGSTWTSDCLVRITYPRWRDAVPSKT